MEKVRWLVLGVTVVVASVFAGRSDRAWLDVRVAWGVVFLVLGAMLRLYAVPMLGALTLLRRAERRDQHEPAPPRHGGRLGTTRSDPGPVVDGAADAELTSGRYR